jgi:hypothetical protein
MLHHQDERSSEAPAKAAMAMMKQDDGGQASKSTEDHDTAALNRAAPSGNIPNGWYCST